MSGFSGSPMYIENVPPVAPPVFPLPLPSVAAVAAAAARGCAQREHEQRCAEAHLPVDLHRLFLLLPDIGSTHLIRAAHARASAGMAR